MLEINNLCVSYGDLEVLRGLSLKLEEGRIHVLIGPSGCGKSTLFKVLCGIHRPGSGDVLYKGRPLDSGRVRIGYVPQNYGLLAWKTVLENILLPLRIGSTRLPGANERSLRAESAEVAAALGLEDALRRYPREISGGQQQRAALARAFILKPDLLLMDEPFSALDAFTSAASRELFLRLWQTRRVTTVLITHNMHEAAALGQKIILMGQRAGTVAKAPGTILTCLENTAFEPDHASSSGPRPKPEPERPPGGLSGNLTEHGREAARLELVRRMSELLREVLPQ